MKLKKERYFGPLIQSGVELSYLKVMTIISLFISGILFWGISQNNLYPDFEKILLAIVMICIFGFLYSMIDVLVVKFKVLSYILLSIMFAIIMLDFNFFGLILIVGDEGLSSLIAKFYIIFIIVCFIGSCAIYIWHYLPQNHGKRWKFNRWGVGKEKSKFRSNFGIVFGAVIFIPALLTGYLQNIFGLFLGFLLTLVMPALVVDSFYAAYHAYKYPSGK
ncbi:TPA: hypothetical protein U1C34_001975 [Streptococcus suis]|nr:hypothetical protein [Streptococcus suis]HEM2582196.1 hypothetical protein [Streptococcus suis]HEM3612091.1 hypothetical protein [Streptococcus suis]HEM3623158.1 hypothetical protein [Streptococcus suis]HEM3627403.1 hypothetical protein [Streptococcus suis]